MNDQRKTKAELIKELTDLRKQVVDTARKNDAQFESLMTHIPEPLFICQMDGTLVYCNPAMTELLNYKKNDLIETSFFCEIIFSEQDLPKAIQNLKKNSQGKSTGPDEYMLYKKDREPVYVQTTTLPLVIGDKKVVVGIARDITEQKIAEEERQYYETQFRRAQRMEAIGALAGGIAHEFNNILSPIMLHTELTMFDLPKESPLRHNLEEVLEASDRARDLINQILALSRQGEEEPYPFKVGPVIKEALKLLRASLPTTIKIRQSISRKSETILADPSQIHQVLMNLCTNAGHAMNAKGGELRVILEDVNLEQGDIPTYPDLNPGPYIKLTVSDTGVGMDQAVLDRIFDPYFTTKKKGRGTGLGLAVVHGIVSSYGGAITVDSMPRKGSTFCVYLPRAEDETQMETDVPSQLPEGTENILLVDDDMSLLNSLKGALERLGYSVTAHLSSIEALENFRKDPNQFDLVITDQTMPNLTGEYLSKELMSIRPDIPIIMCTGFSETFSEKKAKSIGIKEYIMKPIVLGNMAEAIRNTLDETE